MPAVLTMRNMPERARLSAISGVMFCGALASSAKGAIAMGTWRPELVSTLMVSCARAAVANMSPAAQVAMMHKLTSRLNMCRSVLI